MHIKDFTLVCWAEFHVMPEKLFKVIIIGDPTVGKTSFVQRYVQDTFKRDYKGTVGVDFALKILRWSDTQTVKLQLWDIAGRQKKNAPLFFRNLLEKYLF
jgi:small GTP-binding protein